MHFSTFLSCRLQKKATWEITTSWGARCANNRQYFIIYFQPNGVSQKSRACTVKSRRSKTSGLPAFEPSQRLLVSVQTETLQPMETIIIRVPSKAYREEGMMIAGYVQKKGREPFGPQSTSHWLPTVTKSISLRLCMFQNKWEVVTDKDRWLCRRDQGV